MDKISQRDFNRFINEFELMELDDLLSVRLPTTGGFVISSRREDMFSHRDLFKNPEFKKRFNDYEMALDEVVMNAHEHGNKHDSKKNVKLLWDLTNGIEFYVVDQGLKIVDIDRMHKRRIESTKAFGDAWSGLSELKSAFDVVEAWGIYNGGAKKGTVIRLISEQENPVLYYLKNKDISVLSNGRVIRNYEGTASENYFLRTPPTTKKINYSGSGITHISARAAGSGQDNGKKKIRVYSGFDLMDNSNLSEVKPYYTIGFDRNLWENIMEDLHEETFSVRYGLFHENVRPFSIMVVPNGKKTELYVSRSFGDLRTTPKLLDTLLDQVTSPTV